LLWPEYEYELPKAPSDEKQIIGYNRKKSDQIWRKPKLPSPQEWKQMNASDKFRLIERERDRWVNGVWFMNNNEPTYITGKHYDHLTYQTFDYEAKYFESQRHDWYFRDLVKKDPKCFGGVKVKPRRYGATDEEVTDNQYEAISDFNRKIGMMSETRDKVYSTIYDKITTSYLQRPAFIRPDIFMRNGVVPKKKIEFRSNKVKKSGDSEMLSFDMSGSLNSLIEPKATTVIGYDGWKLHKLTMDEIWKWTACSPKACWDKQKKCLFDGGRVIGYAMLLSTMGDDDSYDSAIKDGIEMWGLSNPFERDLNGFTGTGLYRYFIGGQYALRDYADKFGFINMDQAEAFIHNERAKYAEGSSDWIGEVRRAPLTIEEALGSALSTGVFDLPRLSERISIINKKPESERGYVEGILAEDSNGIVEFQPKKDEPWLISHLPLITETRNFSNRFKIFDERYLAPRNPEGCLGYDPIRYADIDVVSSSLSQASIIGQYKFDYFGDGSKANKLACLYLDRPSDPEEGHYEAFKAAKFWGFPIMYERQVESFLRRMREIGALDFILKNPKDGKYGLWTDNRNQVIKAGVDMIVQYWKKPKGIHEIDYLEATEFLPILTQGKEFDPKKTTKFDAMMSWIMCKHGLMQIKENAMDDTGDPNAAYNAMIAQLFPKRN